jgi:DNA adenine methylase
MSKSLSPLRYPGGESRAVKKFSKYRPKDVKTICSPFFGGGSFELYCLMNYEIRVFGYELFKPLVDFWNCLVDDPERLAVIVSQYLPVVTKEQFRQLQRTFRQIQDPWERAAATYVLSRTSFSGSMASGGFSPLEKDGRNGRFKQGNVEFLKNFHVPAGMLSVEHVSFEESILRHPQEFLFLDPPYMVESKLYGHRGDLHEIDHGLLADMLRSRGNWMLCYNNCLEVKRLYQGFHIIDDRDGLSWSYGMSKSKKSKEVLILSKDVAERLGLKVSTRISAGSRRSIHENVPLIGLAGPRP